MLVYKYIYFTVLNIEELYFEWMSDGMGVDGSYRIFKKVCQIYDYMEQVETECFWKEYITEWFGRISGNRANESFVLGANMNNFDAIKELLMHFWLFWYGVYWHNIEDCGLAIGVYAKVFAQLTLDEI